MAMKEIIIEVPDSFGNTLKPEKVNSEIKGELVRCMDCKWWDRKGESRLGYCHACKHGHRSDRWEIGIYRVSQEDWFCADGELEGC